jgi:uncharacterized membrane protein
MNRYVTIGAAVLAGAALLETALVPGVVIGELATAAGLSAFAFVVGPFVYLAHEKAWDYYAPPGEGTREASERVKLLPAPA